MNKVISYSKSGVLAVEMECSAMFCLSMYRQAETAAVLVISDSLHEGVWKPAFTREEVIKSEKGISEILIKQWNKIC